MDQIVFQVKGLDRLLRGLEVAPQTLEAESRQAMERSMVVLKGQVERRIPLGPGREGHLRSMIASHVAGPPIRGMVDAEKFTARFLESGTRPHLIKEPGGRVIHHPGAKAKHPMRRALAASKRVIRAYFLAAAVETLHKIAKGS